MQNVDPSALQCPPGLGYLQTIDQLLVKQKVEMLEAILGCETKNRYEIKNSLGQRVSRTRIKNQFICTKQIILS